MSIMQMLDSKLSIEQEKFIKAKLKNLIAKIDKYNATCMFDDLKKVIEELEREEWRNGTHKS